MSLELTQSDLQKLQLLINEIPHKYAVPIVQCLNEAAQRQAAAAHAPEAKPQTPGPIANGHAGPLPASDQTE